MENFFKIIGVIFASLVVRIIFGDFWSRAKAFILRSEVGQLLKKLKRGMNMNAEKIFEAHLNNQTSLISGVLKNCGITRRQPDYEDYEQDVRLYLFQAWQRANHSVDDFHRIAYTYARSRVLDSIRQRDRREVEVPCSYSADEHITPTYDPDSLHLENFLLSLSPEELAICTLYLHGKNLVEISDELHISRGALNNKIRRMRDRAKDILGGE